MLEIGSGVYLPSAYLISLYEKHREAGVDPWRRL
jgi:hypothetical protein